MYTSSCYDPLTSKTLQKKTTMTPGKFWATKPQASVVFRWGYTTNVIPINRKILLSVYACFDDVTMRCFRHWTTLAATRKPPPPPHAPPTRTPDAPERGLLCVDIVRDQGVERTLVGGMRGSGPPHPTSLADQSISTTNVFCSKTV